MKITIMDENELRSTILPCFERIIKFSLSNNLNIHTPIGGKYAELFVTSELWRHEPKLGRYRYDVKGIKHPGSCDIVLAKTKKKLEVKWGMFHHDKDDPFVKRTDGIPFWGWGFSSGKQFIDRKFDYCILIAAKKDSAYPQHIFVIKCEEMNLNSMGRLRGSGVYNKGSFYIEFSHNKDFYDNRKWHKGPLPLEEELFKNRQIFEDRWEELKKKGKLE